MVEAIFNLDGVPEAVNLPAYTMFMHGSRTVVTGYEVEATCRLIFDMVIDRCYFGFRGAVRDNLALNPTFSRKDDRDGNCLTRITNVTNALRKSKCICRDIIYEDYSCIKLVNAPLEILSRKDKQRRDTMTRSAAIKEGKDAKAALNAAGKFPTDQDIALSNDARLAPNPASDLFDLDMVNAGNGYLTADGVVKSEHPFAFDREKYNQATALFHTAGTFEAPGHENLGHNPKHNYIYGSDHMDVEDLIAGGILSQESPVINPQDGQIQLPSSNEGPTSQVPSPQLTSLFPGGYNIRF